MNTETDLETAREAMCKYAPRKVRAILRNKTSRDISVPIGKKRWQAVVNTIARMAWAKLELLDAAGAVLAIVEAEDEPAAAPAPTTASDATIAATGRDGAVLQLLMQALREDRASRSVEAQAIMAGAAQLMRVMGDAVQMLVTIQRVSIDTQAQALAVAATLQPAEGKPDELESSKLLQQMAPMLMAKLLAPAPAPAPTPPNGVKS